MTAGEERPLNLDEMGGELREFGGRIVALEIRDGNTNLIASAEGEFGNLEGSAGEGWSFELGGQPPREREELRFIAASYISVQIDTGRVREVHDVATGIGPLIVLRVRFDDGVNLTMWPAMPAGEQWTERHEENR